jgi:hypothetical protein
VLNALLFRIPFPYGNADVRRFARATGGEVLYFKGDKLPLMEVFQKLRQRYSLLYAPPGGRRGEMRNIKIELSKPAKASLKKLTIRARSGYVVGY